MSEILDNYSKVFCTYMIEKGIRSAFEYVHTLPKDIRAPVIIAGGNRVIKYKQEFIDAVNAD